MEKNLGAYRGRILKINLDTYTTEDYPFTDRDRELFLGGKVLAAKILYDNIKEKIDPLSPENMMVVTTGPLNGTTAPSSSRFNISAVSPLTEIITSSNCGGNFGNHLKRAGYDGLIIIGRAKEKTIINITEQGVEFKNADHLWGQMTGEVQKTIGGKSGKIVIGPAGENLVKYSCIVSEDRAAGRGGLGAVMGSKNLKAITASGNIKMEYIKPEKFHRLITKWIKRLKEHPLTGKQLPKLGTAGLLSTMQAKRLLATKNFSGGRFDGFEKISGETMAEKHLIKNKGCVSCPIRCGRVVKFDGKEIKGPEVETLGLLGANILNDDLEKIFEWNYHLDELGMDTISCAGTLAFAMELNEKGIWNTGLEFGKVDNITGIIHDIAYRHGEIGDLLAEGTKRLSDKFGGKDFAINSKGMEFAAYEPRAAHGQGLGYAVANRGACHINAGYLVVLEGLGMNIDQYTHKGKATLAMTFQDLMEATSAGGNCIFTTYAFFPFFLLNKPNSIITRIANFAMPHIGAILYFAGKHPGILSINLRPLFPHPVAINYATGLKLNFGKMLRIGERGYNLERLINLRLGMTGAADTLPKRLTEELQDPKNPKSKVPLDILIKRYYRTRSWTKDGVPTKKLIKKLKL